MSMFAHVSKVIKSANYHRRNIEKIRKFLNTDTTKSAIVSLVTSRLDYCNALLCGITDQLLCRLQKVQNNAARVVSVSKTYDHITPVLKDLHWLPIRKRIGFKILLLTFKCMQGCAPLYLRELLVKQANTRTLRSRTYYRYHTLICKGLVTEHSVPMHHAFGMSSLKKPRLLIVSKTSRNSWKHCYFERSLIDYMDPDNCPMTLKHFWTL